MSRPVLEIKNLSIGFESPSGETVRVVNNISLSLSKGSSIGIVGESGSGKSVTCLSIARLLPEPPAIILGGEILFNGVDILQMENKEIQKLRGGEIAYIFQDPSSSLNPVKKIGEQIAESLKLHRPELSSDVIRKEVISWLDRVGIKAPEDRYKAYPHELSGGMQQRAMIAMALSTQPKLLIADEPTTALDVTVQAKILDLLISLKEELGMSLIFVTHNLGIIRRITEEVAVFLNGELVEFDKVEKILHSPQHPYTKALIDCIPKLGANQERLTTIAESITQQ